MYKRQKESGIQDILNHYFLLKILFPVIVDVYVSVCTYMFINIYINKINK